MRYRRTLVPGGTYFFTATLADRHSRLLVERIDILRDAVSSIRARHPFRIDAMVVLPDHAHAVWTLPAGDADFPLRWALIKAAFSRAIEKTEHVSASRRARAERGIWQRRYWEHLICDEDDLGRHVDYIHFNPVKHGYVQTPVEWAHSSIHHYVKKGQLPPDWAGNSGDIPENGERDSW
ncbi:MAG: transposase [Betaproteobacteria bacterium]|nr:transposase [Betaproteobacteria bacterium]